MNARGARRLLLWAALPRAALPRALLPRTALPCAAKKLRASRFPETPEHGSDQKIVGGCYEPLAIARWAWVSTASGFPEKDAGRAHHRREHSLVQCL